MTQVNNNPFINKYNSLDVHGHTEDMVILPVDEFINDNLKLGKEKIIIIHGIGERVLSKKINTHFKNDKRVKNIYLYNENLGMTIIELNML